MENVEKSKIKRTDIGFIPVDWDVKSFGELLDYEQPGQYLVNSSEYTVHGEIAVLTANKSFILGFTHETNNVFSAVPVVIFDDFTTASKLVNFQFKVKSSAIKILKLKNSNDDLKFIFEKMQATQFHLSDHKRYWISEYRNINISYPKPDEQKAIAAALSDVDGLIESIEQLIAKKRDMKTAAMQQLLIGEKRLPGFVGDWKYCKLGTFGNCLRGVSYGGAVDLYQSDNEDAAILLRSNNIESAKINFSNVQYVKRKCVSSEQYLTENDIIICMANGSKKLIGKSAFYSGHNTNKFTFGAFMACFRVLEDKAIEKFIFYMLNSDACRKQIDVLLAGSSINNLTPGSIEKIEFEFPDKGEQAAIANILSDMDIEIDALEQRLAKAKSVKAGMMQELLTGKTRLVKPAQSAK